ncbi:hypothetical protein [Chromobacterium haemolyticum]|uniref:hypothetical protein n=1 Tax=Chromobacterium haemolyticum TaxID=394935 RepID=UPI0011306093|nr:hypothetical protein [Chromobacterium haemolyticum]
MDVIEYDPANGRVLQFGTSRPENIAIDIAAGKCIIQGVADPHTQYVWQGQVVSRPGNPARLVGFELRGLPAPCRIVINGESYTCLEKECALSFGAPGEYCVEVQAWPLQAAVFMVTWP